MGHRSREALTKQFQLTLLFRIACVNIQRTA